MIREPNPKMQKNTKKGKTKENKTKQTVLRATIKVNF